MTDTTDDRWPHWGMLIHAPVERARSLVETAVDDSYKKYKPTDYTLVPGNGWSGFFSFVPEPANERLADAVRAEGTDVMILSYGHVTCVYRWNGSHWDYSEDDPDATAQTLGVIAPGSSSVPSRPRREATLVIGASVAEVQHGAATSAKLLTTDRGVVVLGYAGLGSRYPKDAIVYTVVHYLDDDTFSGSVTRSPHDVGVFYVPTQRSVAGLPILPDIDGETEPRRIVRKLGIPVAFMYPDTVA